MAVRVGKSSFLALDIMIHHKKQQDSRSILIELLII